MGYDRDQNIRKRDFFVISLILHIILLILLFFVYKYSQKYPPLKKPKKQAKLIFKKPKPKPKPQPPKPKTKPKPKPKPKVNLPAFSGIRKPALKPKPPVSKKQEKPKPKPQKPEKKIIEKKTEKKTLSKEKAKLIKKAPLKKQPPKPEKKPELKPKPKPESKKSITLTDISKGFLDYTQKQGANLIQYTKSVEGAPTEEQLKHERYISRVFSCIETTLKIKRNTLSIINPVSPSDVLIVLINIVLNTNGQIANMSIAKTSGILEFDHFMLSLIHDSSSSFPPVPSYLSKDKYYLPIKFFIPAGMVMTKRKIY